MNKGKLADILVSYIDEMSYNDLLELHNAYCDNSISDNHIYTNDEYFWDDIYGNHRVSTIVGLLHNSKDCYNWTNSFVRVIGYNKVESCNGCDLGEWIDISDIVSYIIDNDDDLGNEDIRDILEGVVSGIEEENLQDTLYDYIKSTHKLTDFSVFGNFSCVVDIVNHIVSNNDDFGFSDIRDILVEYGFDKEITSK